MKVKILKSKLQGSIVAPPSKSFAHRQLLASALSFGECSVTGIANSQDMLATLDCIRSLGVDYCVDGESAVVFTGKQGVKSTTFNCRESGSTLRFLIPIALALNDNATFTGTEKLISRGVGIYQTILGEKGISLTVEKDRIIANGSLKSGNYTIAGNVSSQFITGMLFALPLVKGDSVITVTPPVESQSYIDITLQVLSKYGIKIEKQGQFVYHVKGGQKYLNNSSVVEGDWSNAAFLYALKFLGNPIEISGVDKNSVQGDKVCLNLMQKICSLDAKTIVNAPIDLSDCPDLAPVLFALASAFNGGVFIGTKRLAIKESDRAKAMQCELKKFGISVDVFENSVIIRPAPLTKPTELLCGHNDHRIVMALSVLCTLTGGEIDGAEAINKSYPSFFDDITKLGVNLTYEG